MSHVTDVILTCSLLEESGGGNRAIDHINNELELAGKGRLHHLSGEGGTKAWQTMVYGGAFNYLDEEEFALFLENAPWVEPRRVSLMVKGEHDEIMREVCLSGTPAHNQLAPLLHSFLAVF